MSGPGGADRDELAAERDAFLNESSMHSLVHGVGLDGRHQVRLWFCLPHGVESASVFGEAYTYWGALCIALGKLREHPARRKGEQ
jgi:hypothetical protein